MTSAQVKEAAELGSELLRTLKPRGVGKRWERSEAEVAASDARDRMAVVVTRRYAYVERIAGFRWGRELGAVVPAMLSRDMSRGGSEAGDGAEEEVDADEGDEPTNVAIADTNEAAVEEGAAPDEDAADEAAAPKAAPKADARKTTKR